MTLLRYLLTGSRSYVWSFLKSCVKVLIGRKPFFFDRDRFFRRYVLHLLGYRRIRGITCLGLESEGAGSQALMIVRALDFARCSGLPYVHSPFSHIPHADRPMTEWAAAWEAQFNLGAGEAACNFREDEVVNYSAHFNDLERCFRGRSAEETWNAGLTSMVPEIRRKYYRNKIPHTHRDVLTVAVHIRRGDVSATRNEHYFTSTETVLRTATKVKAILDARDVRYSMRVYSQGDERDFHEFSLRLGAELFINLDAIRTMQELIEADILIMAKGCFSHYAALISDGIKISEENLPGLDRALLREPDGSFDAGVFERLLHNLAEFGYTEQSRPIFGPD